MVPVMSLWLPIVVAAVAVFMLSSILHMVLRFHRSDYRQLANETEAMDVLRRGGVTPGLYHMPWCASPKDMEKEEVKAKFQAGPVGLLAVMPSGAMNMGKFLGLWFLYCLLVSAGIAIIAGRSLPAGAEASLVACVTATAAFLAYCLANMVDSIWRGYPWNVTLKHMFDGLLYAFATAGVFTWLWPV